MNNNQNWIFWSWSTARSCLVVVVVVLVLLLVETSQAQDDTSCVTDLVPCLNYLINSRMGSSSRDNYDNDDNDPPRSCCDPLKLVIKSNPECLCTMITNEASLVAGLAGINGTEAQLLPGSRSTKKNTMSSNAAAINKLLFSYVDVIKAIVLAWTTAQFLWISNNIFP
ncbi:Bifunctional inhibitor/plant lipid transfer protein/seed storage helical domain [Macleaya cordata]|uniref:Bifunctional inhibitor/plant lipid transfer protein/seed storage helical domain n=1 Tax=Macleaya cordata TaxID=56857 RepID=A0A200R3N8_MACCD|nr:Bifunctional inhibitor/plant lipid transfer protein/seed storage helical domain [Macleaya cordata]